MSTCEFQCLYCSDIDRCDLYIEEERTDMSEGISKDTFQKMDADSKLDVLFDYVYSIHDSQPKRVRDRDLKCARRAEYCDGRFKEFDDKLQRSWVINTAIVFCGSFIGGWSAVWTAFRFELFM